MKEDCRRLGTAVSAEPSSSRHFFESFGELRRHFLLLLSDDAAHGFAREGNRQITGSLDPARCKSTTSLDLVVEALRNLSCPRVSTPCTANPSAKSGCLYINNYIEKYTRDMDVAVTELRAHLSRWIEAARDGNDVVITDRGIPVARITALDSTPVIDRLISQGIIGRPRQPTRPVAGDRPRPTPKRPVAEIISEQRR